MAIICIGKGTTTLGTSKTNQAGEITERTSAKWEPDPQGGSVCLWQANPNTMEPMGPAEVFGDWQAAEYLARVLEMIRPSRQINVPDLEAMIRQATKDGFNICDYCPDFNCRDCIVNEWKGDPENERNEN